jgi:hypothetical protein
MRSKIAVAVLAIVATVAHTEEASDDYPEVSRLGKNILVLNEVSTPGFTTPSVLFNKVKNATDEPKYKENLTPLGKRQQYIVGGEYRLRYVEEASSFLNYSYDITQLWIQTTFDSKNILSAQAQLHGLYPPSTNINFLNEWQQRNAVPPLDNVLNDQWTAWQQELGDKALPYGFNTFPINVQGHEDDYLLHADGANCPKLNKTLTAQWPAYEAKALNDYKTFLQRLGTTLFNTGASFGVKDGINACDYLLWAYYHDIDLQFSYLQSDIDSCNSLKVSYFNYVLDADQSLGYLGANQFLLKIHDQLSTLTGHKQFKETFFYQTYLKAQEEPHLLSERLESTLDGQPRFYFYTTEQVYMRMLLSGLVGSTNRGLYP